LAVLYCSSGTLLASSASDEKVFPAVSGLTKDIENVVPLAPAPSITVTPAVSPDPFMATACVLKLTAVPSMVAVMVAAGAVLSFLHELINTVPDSIVNRIKLLIFFILG